MVSGRLVEAVEVELRLGFFLFFSLSVGSLPHDETTAVVWGGATDGSRLEGGDRQVWAGVWYDVCGSENDCCDMGAALQFYIFHPTRTSPRTLLSLDNKYYESPFRVHVIVLFSLLLSKNGLERGQLRAPLAGSRQLERNNDYPQPPPSLPVTIDNTAHHCSAPGSFFSQETRSTV